MYICVCLYEYTLHVYILTVLVSFLWLWLDIPNKKQLSKDLFGSCSPWIQSTMVENTWLQEHEEGGHCTSGGGKNGCKVRIGCSNTARFPVSSDSVPPSRLHFLKYPQLSKRTQPGWWSGVHVPMGGNSYSSHNMYIHMYLHKHVFLAW